MLLEELSKLPRRVRIVEVGPRDGLQNEKRPISTAAKVQFVRDLAAAGLPVIEATSFVNPKAIPQLADAAELLESLQDLRESHDICVLVPNEKGLERALAAGVKHIAVFTAASESFNQKNIRCSIDESFARFEPIFLAAKENGLRVRGYLSTVFGCPYEGAVDSQRSLELSLRLIEKGCYEVSIGDTIGVATPRLVAEVLERLLPELEAARLALHFHDTRGTALSNVMVGLRYGITSYDSSAGGLGGCPYAPGAAGNLATEDLVYLLERMGVDTGVDLKALAEASLRLESELGRALPGRTVATFRR